MRTIGCLLLAIFTVGLLPVSSFAARPIIERIFTEPIDGISVAMEESDSVSMQYEANGEWSSWRSFEFDTDRGPENRESELVMLPHGVTRVRFLGIADQADVHPITVSRKPVRTLVAALDLPAAPMVIPRSSWGADASLLFERDTPSRDVPVERGNGTAAETPQNRVDDCADAQTNYPSEFSTSAAVTADTSGQKYRWPLTYSKEVKLLVVHHTALKIAGDPRPAVERVRALYEYHARSRGWGDVGYNYLIDEDGKIYEGRQGGKGVVAGHTYCNNVGTIGVALLGNFELEAPSQKQTAALQKLLIRLGDDYNLDLSRSTQFHGKTFTSSIVRHKDLVSTACPGYYLADAFGQVIRNVQAKNPDGSVKYAVLAPQKPIFVPSRVSSKGLAPGLSFQGRSSITINPGGMQRLSFTYTAPLGGMYTGKKVADVRLGHPGIGLFLMQGDDREPVRTGILLPTDIPDGESIALQLLFTAPEQQGGYWMEIGGQKFMITVTGRRTRTDIDTSRFGSALSSVSVQKTAVTRIRPTTLRTVRSSSSSAARVMTNNRAVRIKLSSSPTPGLTFTSAGTVDGKEVTAGSRIDFTQKGSEVQAMKGASMITSGPILRFAADQNGLLTVDSVRGAVRSYRGIVEARVIDGKIVLINELPLETYLRGLSEEPDTEPYEKQRAFAIAARTYALYYMESTNRKFPNMPYDGSDDPAIFQSYSGAGFESANPSWLRAVTSTNKQVLTFRGSIIKPPYFSSDDGRTRSAAEAGWKTFPFAEIFVSKPDPWCAGLENRGHGVGMSGCGAEGQANEGKTAEQILKYYYPGTVLMTH